MAKLLSKVQSVLKDANNKQTKWQSAFLQKRRIAPTVCKIETQCPVKTWSNYILLMWTWAKF